MSKRYSYFFEIPIFFLVGHLLNYFLFPSQLGFMGISPHPYWLPIFLFALRYGFQAGTICGLFAAINYLFAAKYSAPDYFFEDSVNYLLPITFVALGSLLGGAFGNQLRKIANLDADKVNLVNLTIDLKKQIADLDLIKNQLQGKIATQMSSLVTLYEGTKRLELLDLNQLYEGVLEFVCKVLGVSEAALYLVKDETLILHKTLGWKEHYQRPTQYQLGEGICGIAAKQGKVISIRDFLSENRESQFMGDALFAGPIKNGESGKVVAVLAVWQIPLFKFTSSQLSLFVFLLDWATRAVGRAYFVKELSDKAMMLPNIKVYTQTYFYQRLEQEFNRSKKYYLPMAVALLRIIGIDTLQDEQKQLILQTLAQIAKQSTHALDLVASLGDDLASFGILFVTANVAQIKESIAQIEFAYGALVLGQPLKIAVASFTPQIETYQNLLELARKDLLVE